MWRTAIALIVVAPSAATAADLMQVARQEPGHSRFVALVERAGLAGEMSSGGPYTVFMPSDAAFDRMPPETRQRLADVQRDALRPIVRQHVIRGTVLPSDDIPKTLETAAGGELQVTWERNSLTIFSGPLPPAGEAARVVRGDLKADNGVVHTIDAVLLPVNALEIQDAVADASTGAAGAPRQEATTARAEGGAAQAEASAQPNEAAQPAPTAQRRKVKVYTYVPESQTTTAVRPAEPPRAEGRPSAEAAPRPAALTVEELEDMSVVSRGRDAEGVVEGIVLSPGTGDIDVVLVRFSGFLGMFGKLVVVPWSDITVARGEPLLIADIDAAAIERAEEPDLSRYDTAG